MKKKNTKIIRATSKKLSVSAPSKSKPKSNLYDVDFYEWAKRKAINETNLHEDIFPKVCPKNYKEYLKFGKNKSTNSN